MKFIISSNTWIKDKELNLLDLILEIIKWRFSGRKHDTTLVVYRYGLGERRPIAGITNDGDFREYLRTGRF